MSRLFSGVGDAKVSQGGVYFLPGQYLVEIVKCFAMNSRKREDLFIVECMILESDCFERPVGSKASWIVNFKHDASLGNIKGFLAACNGIDPGNDALVNQEITEDVCEYAVHDENPLAGTRVKLAATATKTKAGNDFTLHFWDPAPEGAPVAAAAAAAAPPLPSGATPF